ncbi:MAG: DUF4352 domain-containing protein [Micrococcales bacterium]|nr:DUF4352 domain-containing protein [Micrococcales bacterium]MCL2667501.1 DUF4352 domain-containing protein [Micrococcales bacterium]
MRSYKNIAITLLAAGVLALSGCADSGNSVDLPSDKPATTDEAGDKEDKAAGTRENPYPIGSTVKGKEWDVTINSVTLDATAAVMAENQFNDPPGEGQQYALVNITVTYTGTDSSTPWTTIKYVGADGSTSSGSDSFAVAPEAFDSLTELYQGGTATGNIVLQVPTEAPETGVLSVEPDMMGDKSFVAVQ